MPLGTSLDAFAIVTHVPKYVPPRNNAAPGAIKSTASRFRTCRLALVTAMPVIAITTKKDMTGMTTKARSLAKREIILTRD